MCCRGRDRAPLFVGFLYVGLSELSTHIIIWCFTMYMFLIWFWGVPCVSALRSDATVHTILRSVGTILQATWVDGSCMSVSERLVSLNLRFEFIQQLPISWCFFFGSNNARLHSFSEGQTSLSYAQLWDVLVPCVVKWLTVCNTRSDEYVLGCVVPRIHASSAHVAYLVRIRVRQGAWTTFSAHTTDRWIWADDGDGTVQTLT